LERIKVMQCETTLIDTQQSIIMPGRLRVLVACEFSGTVREAFLARGHDAWSCDLLPDERGSNRHITGDVRDILNDGWDSAATNSSTGDAAIRPHGSSNVSRQNSLQM
jgi:hypothetical protein